MNGTAGPSSAASSRVVTAPNLVTLVRIVLIPVFVVLIVHRETSATGIVVFSAVVATDWVDGWLARRTGQVSELGKVLDPLADRMAIAAGLVAFVMRGAFPLWAAVLIVARDVVLVVVGGVVMARHRVRIDVRWVGKLATFSLMVAIPWIAWGRLSMPLGEATLVVGWTAFVLGIVESYVAAAVYARDLRRALRT